MISLRQDLSYTLRRLLRSPGFAAAVVISIGLGIAANATIFSMVSRFILSPAPVGQPSTLLSLYTTYDGNQCCNNFPRPVFEDVRNQTKSFSGVAAYDEVVPASISGPSNSGPSSSGSSPSGSNSSSSGKSTGNGEPERIWGQTASANLFDVLQLPMTVGRGFFPQEENQQVIVISHRLWQRRFASDPSINGKVVNLSGRPYTVVGVTPAGFRGINLILDSEFWVPFGNTRTLVPDISNARDTHWLQVVARLKPGTTKAQADADLAALATHLAIAYPATDKGNGFKSDTAGALPQRIQILVRAFLAALSVVVLLVLSIACANVANLMLARSASRQREMAVRLALGATRFRVIRQMLLESILLALMGGIFGTLLSLWAIQALAAFHIPAPIPLNLTLNIDWRTLAYTFFLSVAAGLIFGIVPALAASRPKLVSALRGEDALARPGRKITLRSLLIVGQVAMCLVLLTSTGLFLRSLQQAANIDIGFRSNGIVSAQVDPRLNGYTPIRTIQFLTQLRQDIAAQPGVISAVITDSIPLNGGNRSDGFHAQVKPRAMTGVSEPDPIVEMYMATPGYFDAMGIPRLSGRDFVDEAPTAPKVAIINQVFAQKVFGSESPIGQNVVDGNDIYQVVGVVGNIKSRSLGEDPRPVLFRSLNQSIMTEQASMGYTVMVRSGANPTGTVSTIRNQIRALDSGMAVDNVQTMQEHLKDALVLPRLAATLFGVFGAIGLVLAGVGLYAAMSYSVTRRTREIGIRMALGAQLGAVQRLIVRQGLTLILIAILVGMPAAFALAKLFSSVLYGIHNDDPLTFALVPLFLSTVALIACWLPARRASRVDPQVVLRSE